ncbi:hypothetical protein PVAND_011890 [Polypedilum vanderplanki]|uniref:Peptidase S1 domain-containing protein n=1 Tax=Polypedilum vanderplanki TaxID=319348 RepID=A0A9J6CL08_POLVA|nr:hypothetical protein PVAND_011890 [Polypedilum vanderplanki]
MKVLTLILLSTIFCSSIESFSVRHQKLKIITNDEVFDVEDEIFDRDRRLINANNATDGQFPYSARFSLLRTDGRVTRCSGSIISTNFVLSAGHCIDSRYEEVTAVRIEVGTSNIDVHRTRVYAEEQWWLDASELAALDLAIYRLIEHLTFNSLISSVRLPRQSQRNHEFVGYPSQIIGWGNDNSGSSARILQYGNYRILSNTVCDDRFQTFYEMCSIADDWHPELSTQGGDSGGPMVIFESNIPTQVGIHVRRRVTGGQNLHVATRVSLFLEFINEITGIPIRD